MRRKFPKAHMTQVQVHPKLIEHLLFTRNQIFLYTLSPLKLIAILVRALERSMTSSAAASLPVTDGAAPPLGLRSCLALLLLIIHRWSEPSAFLLWFSCIHSLMHSLTLP